MTPDLRTPGSAGLLAALGLVIACGVLVMVAVGLVRAGWTW